jgi:alpha-1,3-mannosyltransferase
VSGARFSNLPPFVSHAPSRARLVAGLPFPAACCWNGLAALGAAPLRAGLRFRGALAGECRASECSLLCDDLHRLGRGRVVVDPGVRVAYEWEQAQLLAGGAGGAAPGQGAAPGAAGGGSGLPPRQSWGDAAASSVAAAAKAGTGEWRVRLDEIECCDLRPAKTYVDFRRDCRPRDVLARNFTREFLGGAPAVA